MLLWRISNYATLDGMGGLRFSARWHTVGRPIVYAADHPASALLEMLVNLDVSLLPDTFQLLKIFVPDDITVERSASGGDWLENVLLSRAAGDHWLADRRSLILQVPSAILPGVFNTLINPLHPEAPRLKIKSSISVPLDKRLK
jgi:RES domain-containing protein